MLSGPISTPERIGKYYVVHEAGRGSSGTVYLSHDPFYGRDVAIKLYHTSVGDDAESRNARRMFMGEAHMIGKLQHPNIVPIYDAGEENGRRYVVTEHIHGARTLSAYCRPGSLLPVDQVVGIVYKCAKALHYAHTRGVVHRDIKPSNILLTQDGDVRIVDFGIALVADSDVSLLEGVAGSPAYMSPEQVQGHDLGPRSDLYSLGAVMYEMLVRVSGRSAPARSASSSRRSCTAPRSRCESCGRSSLKISPSSCTACSRRIRSDVSATAQNSQPSSPASIRSCVRARRQIDEQERFAVLRKLRFFHDFSHAEIREVMRAAAWLDCQPGEPVLRPGDTDDRFYVVVSGRVRVGRAGRVVGRIETGGCFGEATFAEGSRRDAVIEAEEQVQLLKVTATLLEQASISCQLRFHKVFLKELIGRLQRAEPATRGN